MIWWTGLAQWVFEFPFPGRLISTFVAGVVIQGVECAVVASDEGVPEEQEESNTAGTDWSNRWDL